MTGSSITAPSDSFVAVGPVTDAPKVTTSENVAIAAVPVAPPTIGLLPTAQEYKILLELAGQFVESGFLPTSIRTPAQALAIMLTGRELGIPPMLALRQIHIIEGKPTIAAELQLGMFVRRGGKFRWLQNDGECAKIQMVAPNGMSGTFSFSIEEARDAELLGKKNWKKYPAAMLRARAASLGIRAIAPDISMGMYDPDELGAATTPDGEITDWPSVPTRDSHPADENYPEFNSGKNREPGRPRQDGPIILPIDRMMQHDIPLTDPRCHIGIVLGFLEKATKTPETTKRYTREITAAWATIPAKVDEAGLPTLELVYEWLSRSDERAKVFNDAWTAIEHRIEDMTAEIEQARVDANIPDPSSGSVQVADSQPATVSATEDGSEDEVP